MNTEAVIRAALAREQKLPDMNTDTVDMNGTESYSDDFYVDCPGE
jgi:hypothetical protein